MALPIAHWRDVTLSPYKDSALFLTERAPQRLSAVLRAVSDDMMGMNNDPVSVLCNSYSWRGKLVELSRDIGIFDDPQFRNTLNNDDIRAASLLKITKQKQKHRMIALSRNDARGLMETIEHAIDSRRLDAKSSQSASQLLVKLYETLDILPSSLMIPSPDVTEVDEVPFATGGFGRVFRAKWKDRLVALKLLHRIHNHRTFKQSAIQEIMKCKDFDHPRVSTILGLVAECRAGQSLLYMVSPFVEGSSLPDFIRHDAPPNFVIINMCKEIVDGIIHIHDKGIIHGDLRGSNILVGPDAHVTICDYGLSKFADASTTSYCTGGSISWMAPELFEPRLFGCSKAKNTRATDVYAFACVVYEVFSGHPPFANDNDTGFIPLQVIQGIRPSRPTQTSDGHRYMPDDLWDLVNRCWSPMPTDRPSMTDVSQWFIDEY